MTLYPATSNLLLQPDLKPSSLVLGDESLVQIARRWIVVAAGDAAAAYYRPGDFVYLDEMSEAGARARGLLRIDFEETSIYAVDFRTVVAFERKKEETQ